MKIIITGADGFIGGHLVPLLLKKYKKSNLFCLVGAGKSQLARRAKKILKQNKIKFLTVDLLNEKNLEKLPKFPDIVIHLAANTDTSDNNHQINDQGTKNLFNSLYLNSKTHFIYTSTTATYSGRENVDEPITDQTIPKPTNEYGRSKLKAEKFLKLECPKRKIPLTILRINTVYGDDPRKHKMFMTLKNMILENSVFGRLNWPGLTSLIHVEDVAEVIIKIAKNPPKLRHQTFLLYAESFTLSQISSLMHQALGKTYRPISLPQFFWKVCASLRRFIPLLESILPTNLYNVLWRFGLIIDDVIYCQSEKLFRKYPNWKMRKLKDTIKDTLT